MRTEILGTGHYVPDKVVTNDDLAALMDTNDAWIQERTGIVQRRFVDFDQEPMGSSDLGTRAARAALESANLGLDGVDAVVYATLSSDRVFPGDGVLVQHKLGLPAGVPCYDLRNQCSGFVYGLQMSDALIRQGIYRRILLIGAEVHSSGLEFNDRGRDVAVLFGDGAAAVVLGATQDDTAGVRRVVVHADGRHADILQVAYPSSARLPRVDPAGPKPEGSQFPMMEGATVFKHAITRMPQAVSEVLELEGLRIDDIDLLIPHQANLRIAEAVQRRLGLPDDKVFNNIQRYGNTTAASIPLALDEAIAEGRLRRGQLLCVCAFGAGFTWGAGLIRY